MNNKKPRWFKSLAGIVLSVTLTVPLLAACAKGENADNQTERVLRIATPYYGGDDEYFRQQFTEVFEFANPNIKVEIVSAMDSMGMRYGKMNPDQKPEDPLEKLKELMTGDNPPDVVMMNYDQLPDLIANNMLQPLDPLITKDKFDTSDIVPAVIDGLKSLGDGKLFALAPTFTSQVLMYNKKLFADAGVEPPKDDMTWDEVFDLARRVSKGEGENRKYGFAFSPHAFGGKENLFHEMYAYTAPLQLRVFDDNGEKMTVDTDQWEKVWKTMYELSKEKIFPEPIDFRAMEAKRNPEEFNPFQHDNFLSGRLAMTIASTWNINEVIRANKEAVNNVKGFTPIDWDIVTMPSHAEAKGIGGNVYLNGIMGINAKAQNADDAWRFIKFINGEDWARLKSRSVNQLVSRAKYIQPKDGMTYNIKAFYKLKPVPMQNDMSKLYREKPNISQVQYMGQQYFKQAMDGTLGVRDALKQWQTAGDAALKQLKENPNAPINMPMPMGKAVMP